MRQDRQTWYRSMLSSASIDLRRERAGIALGLRDGALFALLAAGLGFTEIADLRCDAIAQDPQTGRLKIKTQRGPWRCELLLGEAESARVLAWIMERRAWASPDPLFGPSRPRLQRIVRGYQARRRRAAR